MFVRIALASDGCQITPEGKTSTYTLKFRHEGKLVSNLTRHRLKQQQKKKKNAGNDTPISSTCYVVSCMATWCRMFRCGGKKKKKSHVSQRWPLDDGADPWPFTCQVTSTLLSGTLQVLATSVHGQVGVCGSCGWRRPLRGAAERTLH